MGLEEDSSGVWKLLVGGKVYLRKTLNNFLSHRLSQVPHRFLRLSGAAPVRDQARPLLVLPLHLQPHQLPRHRAGHPHHRGRGGSRVWSGGGHSARFTLNILTGDYFEI